MSREYRLGELARRVGGRVHGDPERPIRGIAPLGQAGPDELSFLTNKRYREAARATDAGAVLVGPDSGLSGRDLLEAGEPYVALAELLELYHPPQPPRPGISADARLGQGVGLGRDVEVGAFAVIGDRVELGDGAVVGPGCVLGDDCRVGRHSMLHPRVVLYAGTRIGDRCRVHSGVVLGGDGFGFATSGGRHRKIPQVGYVVLEDDVEIGANSAVDRAMLGETRIGRGSKIDDLVMIAHGVQIGPGALFAAQSGVAGSARLGARTTLAGQSGVAGHLQIADDVTVAAKSAVFGDLPEAGLVAGVPAVDHLQWKRQQVMLKKLPELQAEVRDLRARLAALERRTDGRTES